MTPIDSIKALTIDYLVNTAQVPREELANGAVKLSALNIDSLSLVEMLWMVEEQYGVTIGRTEALRDMTLDDMVAALAEQHRQRGQPGLDPLPLPLAS
ncbi:acyl carrier protein [Ideonella azotifigens]|uniref:Carrier domain-containing protein n=1 Tax=Ideonella azotifigens TaxID=513160 RepID=A0ABN1JNA8_9BURK|nr:acyl carrier protein [Ideonella azotifigens]MCD2339932.1 acyl carrier protein [Ideonella azotifigens]